jgi:endonuclease/exonuclease/phosphatase (EEP) superfamily protein YafD
MAKFLFLFTMIYALMAVSENLLLEFGQAPSIDSKAHRQFTLTVWNIYKGGKNGLYSDLAELTQQSDFVLTQEFLLNDSQKQLMAQYPQTHWALAKSFMDDGEWTGVATMSKWQPFESIPVRSPGTEPLVATPKMSLISKYKIANTELWIVNLHGLNFNITHVDFEEQIDDIISRIRVHSGPMIFAGDFNTWSDSRREYLLQRTESLGLIRVDLENPMGFFGATLDHIFYRGVNPLKWSLLSNMTSSDHLPLQLQFEL